MAVIQILPPTRPEQEELVVAIHNWTIDALLKAISQPKPAWGGGSAGATAGAMAFALIEKISRIAKIDANELVSLRNNLLQLAEEDTLAYLAMIKQPGNSTRSLATSAKIAEVCLSGIQITGDLLSVVKPVLRADLFVAAHLCYTGCYSALVNLRTNVERLYPENDWVDRCHYLESRVNSAADDIRRWTMQYAVSEMG